MDSDFADALSEPFECEGRVTDLLRGAGVSEVAGSAFITAMRLLKWAEPELSPPTLSYIRKELSPPAESVPKPRRVEALAAPRSLTEVLDGLADRCVEIRKQADDVEQSADQLLNQPLDSAYSEITRRAKRLVEKSAGKLTLDAAVLQVMENDPGLYDGYVSALTNRQIEEMQSEQAARQRDLDRWTSEQG